MRKVCLMILKCLAEPKRRYLAQSCYFDVKVEPSWLTAKIYTNGKRSGFRYCTAEKFAEITVLGSRLFLCPAGSVLQYNKQGLCVPKSQSKAADFLAALLFGGLPPPNPPERRDGIMGKDIRIAVRVTAKEKEKIKSKARKCGLSTTEYVKQRALGYEPRGIPPDALFLCLE
ncbi:MAG: plasmid mobilization protein, partial [Acutalibacteraceae bacterium]